MQEHQKKALQHAGGQDILSLITDLQLDLRRFRLKEMDKMNPDELKAIIELEDDIRAIRRKMESLVSE